MDRDDAKVVLRGAVYAVFLLLLALELGAALRLFLWACCA